MKSTVYKMHPEPDTYCIESFQEEDMTVFVPAYFLP